MAARGLGNFASFLMVFALTQSSARMSLGFGPLLQACARIEVPQFNTNMTEAEVFWTNFVQGSDYGLA